MTPDDADRLYTLTAEYSRLRSALAVLDGTGRPLAREAAAAIRAEAEAVGRELKAERERLCRE